MRKENVKVILWGFGAMGSGIAKMLLKKKGVEIVGVCDMYPKIVGKSMFEILDIEKGDRKDITISNKIEEVITEKAADIVLLATDSFVKGAFDKIIYCLKQGINVITTAEQMAYPQAQEPELAAELDRIAKENNVTVLGTGINPGLNTSSSWFCASIFWLRYDFNTLDCVLFCSIGPNVLWDFGPMYGIDTLQTIDLGY